jgi:GNAT superfamily N-acetyltransferase
MSGHTGLATGWDAGTPATDTLLRAVSLSMADPSLGAHKDLRTRATDAWCAVDHGVPAGFGNAATLLQPLPFTGWEQVLDEIEAFFAERPSSGEDPAGHVLLFSPWPTPDLRARPIGWMLHGHPPLMTRPAGPSPASARLGPAGGGRVERVADAAALADFERTLVEAFPFADAASRLPGGLFGPALLDDRRWHLYLGLDGQDRPVATAAAFVDHGHNDVNFVSTRPDARGRGFGEAVTWAATRADPARPAALIASDDGRPVYERMGYRALLRFTLWGLDRP